MAITILNQMKKEKLITPTQFVLDSLVYLVYMGSRAYGTNREDSDYDLYGITIPGKEVVFPHLSGEIQGFDKRIKRFDQYQQNHIIHNKKEYDLSVYSIVKFFRLAADASPNIIDSLFVPTNCVAYSNQVGNMIRENRHLFLSKKLYHTLKGYSFSQKHKMKTKTFEYSKRKEEVDKHGYCVKYASHLVRLLNQCEQILVEGDLDLQKNREQLKSIRRGEWSMEQVEQYFTDKEKVLEKLYVESKAVSDRVREEEIKQLLVDCLEHHFGSLENCLASEDKSVTALRQIKNIVDSVV